MNRTVIFINSLFPCLSETFVYDQFRALEAEGLTLRIVSNHRPAEQQVHPRMRDIQSRVDYLSEASMGNALFAHAVAFFKHPLRYLGCLSRLSFSEEPLKVAVAQFTGAALILYRYGALPRLHLHAHFTYGAAAVALWANRLAGTPYSLTLHGSDLIFDNPADLRARLRAADAIVSISQFNIDYLQEHFADIQPARIAVIRMGIEPLAKVPVRPPRTSTLRLLNIGRLSEHKAQHFLIEACAQLAQRKITFQCDIVGEGDRRDALARQIASLGLDDRVHLLGPRFHHEVLALYNSADLFVLCSIAEGQPIVLMEAMRAGIPLIATRISAIPELVQDGGVLVPPANAMALADAIEAFVRGSTDSEKMAARARDIVANEYDLGANHRKFLAFLDALP